MAREVKDALRDASLTEISAELRERGWRIIPVEVLGMIASGAATGWWPSIEKAREDG